MLADVAAVLHQPFGELKQLRWSELSAFHDEARRIAEARGWA